MGWIIPLIASIVSLVLAMALFSQWFGKKTIHTFWYAVSLFMFTAAVFAEFYAYAFGWNEPVYKIYYFFAIALVAYMAAGTMYLVAAKRRWIGHAFLAYALITTVLFLSGLWNAEINKEVLFGADVTIGGAGFLTEDVRGYSIWLSAVGGAIILLGALYSWWRTRAIGNLYIAGAALIMSMGGRLAKMGYPFFLPLSELLGVCILYYGVVLLQTKQETAAPAEEKVASVE